MKQMVQKAGSLIYTWYKTRLSSNFSTESFFAARSTSNQIMGYCLGKAEGEGKLWHRHVSAMMVAPKYHRLGLAATLMQTFEAVYSMQQYNAYFVDLFEQHSCHSNVRKIWLQYLSACFGLLRQ